MAGYQGVGELAVKFGALLCKVPYTPKLCLKYLQQPKLLFTPDDLTFCNLTFRNLAAAS
jgi:hypothetical protein